MTDDGGSFSIEPSGRMIAFGCRAVGDDFGGGAGGGAVREDTGMERALEETLADVDRLEG
jgi:hypothetical protein